MFSKFPTFRRKEGSSVQKGKLNRFSRFISESHSKEEIISCDLGASYFMSKSSTANETASEVSDAQPVLSYLDASPLATRISDENSSTGSFGGYSTYDSKESSAVSTAFHDEIDVGLSVLHSYEDAEEQFLQDHEGYFLNIAVDNVRKIQYPELELQKIVYLDYATCALFSRYQVEQHMQILFEERVPFLVSNSTTFYRTAQGNSYINSTYENLLDILNTTKNDYSIIFTTGLSSCYRLFSEIYHFQKGSVLLVGHDNHESVQHILHAAVRCSARIGAIPLRDKDLCIPGKDIHKLLKKQGWSGNGCGLLVYPAQSCSSGVRHSLNWIVAAQQNQWKVLLDVSSCLPMVGVDLSLYRPEFVIGSFQQMIGYPANLGFLLVRRSSHSISDQKEPVRLKIVESPETGKAVHVVTEGEILSLHIFAALSSGLEYLESVGLDAIQKRVEALASWLVKTLKSLRHKLDDKPLLQLYGSLNKKHRGSILTFNVLDPTGNIFPSRLIQRLAERSNIILGICTLHNSDLPQFLHGKSEKKVDAASIKASPLHLPVVRLSLGPVSTFDDIYRLVQFLLSFREEDYMSSEAAKYVEELGDEH